MSTNPDIFMYPRAHTDRNLKGLAKTHVYLVSFTARPSWIKAV